ncbi:phage/plasmid primase, P4 family [Actinomadura montaniterrae]|uniref:phage/plasmid primase, P4 family n=1 Tax=Actinomadura montaniterrae TaxID=1803903 RepID=UPI00178C5319|nr:phage/plasmid primase, P4 family [Actinomadura montaniterrae]
MNDEAARLYEAAQAFAANGFSVVPARADGTKAPISAWKIYQTERPTAEQVNAWFATEAPQGIGVVTGAVSGGLEMLEFEGRAVREGFVQRLADAFEDHGLGELWRRLVNGYLESTPSNGLHILYRVDGELRGNTKLARRPARDDELTESERAIRERQPGKQFVRVLIETRGEGGYVVTAPSAGRTHPSGGAWTLLAGGPETVAAISEEERDAVHAIASLLDAMPAPAAPPAPAPSSSALSGPRRADGKRPGDDFNERADWREILAPHGWTAITSYGRGLAWRRPGKDRGISATTGTREGDNLFVFSSSTEFEPETPYSKFGAYALLEHGGDHAAAARELARQGYGDPMPREDDDIVTLIADYRPAVHGPFTADNPRPGAAGGTEGNLATVHELRPVPVHPDYGHEQHRGQLRFAHRFTARWGGEYLHVHGVGWHHYDGTRWAQCLDGGEHRAVLALVSEAFTELPEMTGDARTNLFKDIGKVESASGVRGVLDLASNMHPCTLAGRELDADPRLLNTATGTVHLEAGTLAPPDPADHLSKVTRAGFDPDARSEVFEEFLERIQPDGEMRAFLARQLGYALLGLVREHVLFIWHGLGANGKGTLRDAILHALGDYAIEVPADLLLVTRNANLAPERMRLKGARIAFCSEIGEGAKLDEPTMKKLTGGDPVNAKMLYRNPIQFDPTHTLFMLTNHLPQVRGDDPATWRRILAVPFDVIIPAEERDGELPEKLKGIPDAILAWLWRGWQDYRRQGLNPPASVLAATRKYQLDSDVLARFLADEEAVVLGHGSVNSAVLYKAFTQWCKEQGEDVQMTNKAFTEALEGRGHRKKRTNTGAVWEHIMITGKDAGESRSDGW